MWIPPLGLTANDQAGRESSKGKVVKVVYERTGKGVHVIAMALRPTMPCYANVQAVLPKAATAPLTDVVSSWSGPLTEYQLTLGHAVSVGFVRAVGMV